jgi:hypothetical protein
MTTAELTTAELRVLSPGDFEVPNEWSITGASGTQPPPTEAAGYPEAVQWHEIEELFSSHLHRFDSLYRRLA